MSDNVMRSAAVERAVLQAVLLEPTRFADVDERLTSTAFTVDVHRTLYDRLTRLHAASATYDMTTVLGDVDEPVRRLVSDLIADTAASLSMLDSHVRRLAELAVRRRVADTVTDVGHRLLHEPDIDVDSAVADIVAAHETARIGLAAFDDETVTYDTWARLAETDPSGWVVPGLVRERSRVMMLGPEGMGKSTLLRQIAVCVAAGLHPFFYTRRIEPRRVLIVDVENDPRFSVNADGTVDRASPLGLLHTVDRMVTDRDDSMCRVLSAPGGLDIRDARVAHRLARAMRDHRPDITIMGPIYKLHRRRPGESGEDIAKEMQDVFDRLRVAHDTALLIEHHQPMSGRESAATPFGSSLWMRWPDIGIALRKSRDRDNRFDVIRFRGHRYPVPGLPTALDLDARMPFVGYYANGYPEDEMF